MTAGGYGEPLRLRSCSCRRGAPLLHPEEVVLGGVVSGRPAEKIGGGVLLAAPNEDLADLARNGVARGDYDQRPPFKLVACAPSSEGSLRVFFASFLHLGVTSPLFEVS